MKGFSPSIKIAELLESENVIVVRHDPHVKGTDSFQKAVKDADVIILATNHPEFADILPRIYKVRNKKGDCIIFDCWNMLDKKTAEKYWLRLYEAGQQIDSGLLLTARRRPLLLIFENLNLRCGIRPGRHLLL